MTATLKIREKPMNNEPVGTRSEAPATEANGKKVRQKPKRRKPASMQQPQQFQAPGHEVRK